MRSVSEGQPKPKVSVKSSGETQLRAQLELTTQQLAEARAANAELERESTELRETVFELSLRLSETSASQGDATVFSIDDGGFFTPGLEYENPNRQGDGGRQPRAHRPRMLETADGMLSSSASAGNPSGGAVGPGYPANSPPGQSDSVDGSKEGDPANYNPSHGSDASGRGAAGRSSPGKAGPLQSSGAAPEGSSEGGRRSAEATVAPASSQHEAGRGSSARPGSASAPEMRAPAPPSSSFLPGSSGVGTSGVDASLKPLSSLRVPSRLDAASDAGLRGGANSPMGGAATSATATTTGAGMHHFSSGRPGLGLGAELRGHVGAVYALKFSSDGDWLCSGGLDTKVRLWDLKSQTEATAFLGHTQVVSCLGVAEDDRYVYSGSYDKSVRCWDVEAGRESGRVVVEGMVQCFSLAPRDCAIMGASSSDGLILVGSTAAYVSVVDPRVGSVVAKWRAPAPVTAAHAYPHVTTTRKNLLHQPPPLPPSSLLDDDDEVNAMAAAAAANTSEERGVRLLTADAAGNTIVWDASTGKPMSVAPLAPHFFAPGALASDHPGGNGHSGSNGSGHTSPPRRSGPAGSLGPLERSGLHVSCLAVAPPREEGYEGEVAEGAFAAAVCGDNSLRILERSAFQRGSTSKSGGLYARNSSSGSSSGSSGVGAGSSACDGVLLRARHTLRGPKLRSWPVGAAWWRGQYHRTPKAVGSHLRSSQACAPHGVVLGSGHGLATAEWSEHGLGRVDVVPGSFDGGSGSGGGGGSGGAGAMGGGGAGVGGVPGGLGRAVPWNHAQVLACGSADGKVYLFDATATPRLPPVDPNQIRTVGDMRSTAAASTANGNGSSDGRRGSDASNGSSSNASSPRETTAASEAPLEWSEFSDCPVSDGAKTQPSNGNDRQGSAPVPVQVLTVRGGVASGPQRVYAVEWHPHEPRLASGGADGVVRLWAPMKANPPRGSAAAARGAALRR